MSNGRGCHLFETLFPTCSTTHTIECCVCIEYQQAPPSDEGGGYQKIYFLLFVIFVSLSLRCVLRDPIYIYIRTLYLYIYMRERERTSYAEQPLPTQQSILMQHKAHSNNKCKQIIRQRARRFSPLRQQFPTELHLYIFFLHVQCVVCYFVVKKSTPTQNYSR